MDGAFEVVAEVALGTGDGAFVYEHGWQSWSPAGAYPATIGVSPRPRRPEWQTMAFRPGHPGPVQGFQSEGLAAVTLPTGETRTWVAPQPTETVPTIRIERSIDRLLVSTDGPIRELPRTTGLERALAAAGDDLAVSGSARPSRDLIPGWCSWYGYSTEVTDEVVALNLTVIEREELEIGLIQIDDGYQAAIGDWLASSGRVASMAALAGRIRDGGREAGVWTAPFMVAVDSELARTHPDWLVRDAIAAPNHWGRPIRVLDVTHPDAADHLATIFRTLRAWGFSFHKIDFLYAGAMTGGRYGDADPIAAYREGLRIIREAVGHDAVLLGCGAPLLPSIGLVDAMRISPDTDRRIEPPDGDPSQPALRSAIRAGTARGWMHGRLWVNDPDCLIAGPDSEDRETWSAYLASQPGLAMSGDRLMDLDARGLELTRRFLHRVDPRPVPPDAVAGVTIGPTTP